ncbi:hypothetical protein H8959_004427 [Pygathrix nigripes]
MTQGIWARPAFQLCSGDQKRGLSAGEAGGGHGQRSGRAKGHQRAPVRELLGLGWRSAELGRHGWCQPTNDEVRASGRRRLRGRLGCRRAAAGPGEDSLRSARAEHVGLRVARESLRGCLCVGQTPGLASGSQRLPDGAGGPGGGARAGPAVSSARRVPGRRGRAGAGPVVSSARRVPRRRGRGAAGAGPAVNSRWAGRSGGGTGLGLRRASSDAARVLRDTQTRVQLDRGRHLPASGRG